MKEVRLQDIPTLVKIQVLLGHDQAVLVNFCAQATRLPLLIVPDSTPVHMGFEGTYSSPTPGVYTYVALVEFGRCYPLRLGRLSSGYVSEKLGIHNRADSNNITVFLNALGHLDSVEAYLATVPLTNDHVDHEKWIG